MADGTQAPRRYVRTEYAYKVEAVQAACRRIEAGETVTDVCRDPRMPQRSTFVSWLAAEPELAALVEAAKAMAARSFPQPRRQNRWSWKLASEFLARIEDGRGLRDVCAEPDMPVHSSVTRWLKERPDFAAAYRLAREAQADRLFDLAWRIALDATPGDVTTARLKIQTLKWRVARLAPQVYGPQKAQAPDAGTAPAAVRFEVRRFAVSPEGATIETTRAVRGLSPEAIQALRADIRAGRVTVADLGAMARKADADLAAGRSG